MKKIKSLDGMRFIMMMVIVLSHFEFLELSKVYGDFYTTFLHNPTMGVDFFFLLSGFGMMWSYKGKVNANIHICFNYAWGKIKKIYPYYFTSLLVCIPYWLVVYSMNDKSFLAALATIGIKFIVDLPLIQSAAAVYTFSNGINGVCWFLSSLACIYFVSPIILNFIENRFITTRRVFIGIVSIILLTILIYIFFEKVQLHTPFNNLTYGSPYIRVFYVILGMLVGRLRKLQVERAYVSKFEIRRGIDWFVIIMCMVYFFSRSSIPIDGHFKLLIDLMLVTALVYVLSYETMEKVFGNDNILRLGSISMYLFLFHYPIRMYVDLLVEHFFVRSTVVDFIEVLLIVWLSFAVAFGCNKLAKRNKNV